MELLPRIDVLFPRLRDAIGSPQNRRAWHHVEDETSRFAHHSRLALDWEDVTIIPNKPPLGIQSYLLKGTTGPSWHPPQTPSQRVLGSLGHLYGDLTPCAFGNITQRTWTSEKSPPPSVELAP